MFNALEPPPQHDQSTNSSVWRKWFWKLWTYINNNMNKDFFFEVAKGNVNGHGTNHVLAANFVSTAAFEGDLWPTTAASSTKTWRTSAATLEAVSDNAADDADVGAGTPGAGANTITVYGLDANFNEISEDIDLNGTTASTATTQSFIRVNLVVVKTVGTYGVANTGNITVRVSGAGAIEAYILAGVGTSANSHYTVPAGKTAYLNRVMLNTAADKTVTHFKLWARQNADDIVAVMSPKILVHEWPGVIGLFEEHTRLFYRVPEKTDIWFTFIPGTTNVDIHVDYDVTLVDN